MTDRREPRTEAGLRDALEADKTADAEARAIMERNGFVIDMDLSKPMPDLTEAERWQKLAFTFYTEICQIASRAERALDEAATRVRVSETVCRCGHNHASGPDGEDAGCHVCRDNHDWEAPPEARQQGAREATAPVREWLESRRRSPWSPSYSELYRRGYDTAVNEVEMMLDESDG